MKTKFTLFLLLLALIKLNASTININTKINSDYTQHVNIGYTDKFSYKLDDNVSWKIKNLNDGMPEKSGFGAIENITFSKAGDYEITITDPSENSHSGCSHAKYPNKIMLHVSSKAIKFDFSTIKLKYEIVGGISQTSNELTIDVEYTSVDNSDYTFDSAKIIGSGVDCSINGELINGTVVLKPGINHLVYKLSGQAKSDTYIMLDFYGSNNQISTFSNTNPIK